MGRKKRMGKREWEKREEETRERREEPGTMELYATGLKDIF